MTACAGVTTPASCFPLGAGGSGVVVAAAIPANKGNSIASDACVVGAGSTVWVFAGRCSTGEELPLSQSARFASLQRPPERPELAAQMQVAVRQEAQLKR